MELVNHTTETENLGKLYGALAKAQAEIEVAKKDKDNPFFKSKYADFAAVTQAVKPLHKYGLCYFQPVSSSFGADGNFVIVETVIAHESGASISSSITVPLKQVDAQGVGSASTYGRRYGLIAMAGIAPDDDDDGNAAVGNKCNAVATSPPKPSPAKQNEPESCSDCKKTGVPLKKGKFKTLCADCEAKILRKKMDDERAKEAELKAKENDEYRAKINEIAQKNTEKKAEKTPSDYFEEVGKTDIQGSLFEASA